MLEGQRKSRGIGLTAAAVEALAVELGGVLADLEREAKELAEATARSTPAAAGIAFPARDQRSQTRVSNPQRIGLLLNLDEALALQQASDKAGVSMSHLVSTAVERRFGKS